MSERKTISSGAPWESVVGYSRAVRCGNHIWVAGTTATDETGQVIGAGDAATQAQYALEKIERALQEAGASLRDVVRTRMFVTDISQWEAIGRVHGKFFGDVISSFFNLVLFRWVDLEIIRIIYFKISIGRQR